MNNRNENEKPEGFMAHIPAMFAMSVILTLLTAIWMRPPWRYVVWSMALGIPWLVLLAFSWRMRSDLMTMAVTLPIVGLLIWLSPGGLLSVVLGYLMSACSAFLLMWLGRQQLQRIVRGKRV